MIADIRNDNSTFQDDLMVSVIMLAYNHVDFIAQAVESVLKQKTDFEIELLIGDDASTDGTASILKEYQSRHPDIIKLFLRERNVGVSRNSYDLMRAAKGKYIACCEGDDYWLDEQKLKKQTDFLENNPDYSAVTNDCLVVNADGSTAKRQKIRWISTKREYTSDDFKGIFLPGHPSSVMRRNLFLDEDFDGSIIYKASDMISDRTIALIWAAKGKIYRMPEIMSSYRIHSESVTEVLYKADGAYESLNRDLEYTLALERYATDVLEKKIDFDYHKSELLASVFVKQFRGAFSDRRLSELKKRIKRSCNSPVKCTLAVPRHLFGKAVFRLFGK